MKFHGHTGRKINDLNPIVSKSSRPVAAIKSLRFALVEYLPYTVSLGCMIIFGLVTILSKCFLITSPIKRDKAAFWGERSTNTSSNLCQYWCR